MRTRRTRLPVLKSGSTRLTRTPAGRRASRACSRGRLGCPRGNTRRGSRSSASSGTPATPSSLGSGTTTSTNTASPVFTAGTLGSTRVTTAGEATHWDFHIWDAGTGGIQIRPPFSVASTRRLVRNQAISYPQWDANGHAFKARDRPDQSVEDSSSVDDSRRTILGGDGPPHEVRDRDGEHGSGGMSRVRSIHRQ